MFSLLLIQYDVLELFDEEKYRLEPIGHTLGNDDHLGEITIEFINTASDTADFTNNTLGFYRTLLSLLYSQANAIPPNAPSMNPHIRPIRLPKKETFKPM